MTLTERVKKLLQDEPNCRDKDSTLCGRIWEEDCKKMDIDFHTLSAIQFIHYMDKGKLSKQQSILRVRRKLNNKMSETVGKSYKPKTSKPKTSIKKAPTHIWRRLDINGDVDGKILCSHKELVEIHENMHSIHNRHPNRYEIINHKN